ncbi:hypothetical protein CROQUDRAFT_707389 [Cronartium quercuum f. sp. fusiforme G11]|uniref:DAGKc domain-containing protein n=1 Tax=Cronartium quercuum f. sp. fusiforme G11 TaxID=708437 RepID=A0A9P6NG36_9BASI|nr:hypothetical protein CROQUDRAFT_707389 [Cronartium quercuum f. sp. fusiforme G11]
MRFDSLHFAPLPSSLISDPRILNIQLNHKNNLPAQLIITPDGVILHEPNPNLNQSHKFNSKLSACLSTCFPAPRDQSKTFYPFQRILDCSLLDSITDPEKPELALSTLTSTNPKTGRVSKLKGRVTDLDFARRWREEVLSKAYDGVDRTRRMLVIVNPFGGSGKGHSVWTNTVLPILQAADASFEVIFTTHRGHGMEIGEQVDLEKFDVLVCVSGDGIVHEIINGIGRRHDAGRALRKLSIASVPAGSGNALTVNNMGPEHSRDTLLATLTVLKGLPVPLDLCSVTQEPTEDSSEDAEPVRMLSFLSTSFGLMADLDVGTEHWRWMGETRFILGYLKGALANPKQRCRLDVLVVESDKPTIEKEWRRQREEFNKSTAPDHQVEFESDGLPALSYGDVRTPIAKTPIPHFLNPTSSSSPDSGKEKWYTLEESITSIYAGTLPFMAADLLEFPMKLTGDGSIDIIVHQSPSVLRTLLCIDGADQGSMFRNEDCRYFKTKAFRLTPLPGPNKKSFLVVDGENMPYRALQAEIHSGLANVLSLQHRLGEKGVPEKFLL